MKSLIPLLLFVVTFCSISYAQIPVLILEDGFEIDESQCPNNGNEFFDNCVPSWSSTNGTPDVLQVFNGILPAEGNNCAHMYATKAFCPSSPGLDRGEGIALNYDFENGKTYKITFKMRTDGFVERVEWQLTRGLANITGDGCQNGELVPAIPANSLFIWQQTNYEENTWTTYTAQFDVPDDQNVYDQLWLRVSMIESNQNETGLNHILLDAFKLERIDPCEMDAYFFSPRFCRENNKLVIYAEARSDELPYHQWTIYLKQEGAQCEPNNLNNATEEYDEIFFDVNATLILPGDFDDWAGRCIVIKHGSYIAQCGWKEFRRAITVPNIPEANSHFERSGIQVSQTAIQWTYSSFSNSFPVAHSWQLQVSSNPAVNGWSNIPIATPNDPQFSVTLNTSLFIRVTHCVESTLDGLCSSSCRTERYEPALEEFAYFVYDENGNLIDRIYFDELPPDASGGRLRAEDDQTLATSSLRLFPNPAKAAVEITNPYLQPVVLEFYQSNGQLAYTKVFNSAGTEKVSLDHLSNGLYFINIRDQHSGEVLQNEKLVILD